MSNRGKVLVRSYRDSWERYWRIVHRLDPAARSPEDRYVDWLLERATGGRWLDAGCGRQSVPPWRRGELEALGARPFGCDLDRAALRESAHRDRVCAAPLEALPYGDGSFDLVTSNMVFEHLDAPEAAIAELVRVTAPGGAILVHTVNALHYQAWLAHATPLRFHRWLVLRTEGRDAKDVYPTRYRANTERRLRALFESCGCRLRRGGAIPGIPVHVPYPGLFQAAIAWGLLESRLAALPGVGALWRPNLLMQFERPS